MHALEIGSAGQVAFASRQEPAWHNLGTVFQEDVSTTKMLELAHLNNWNVRLVDPSEVYDANFVSPTFWVVRDNPFEAGQDVLATVGGRYKVYQNEELFAFGDTLTSGGRWETAGSIRDGRVVFASLALDREIVLDPNGVSDVVKNYVLLTTSHDGSTSITAATTPVRVVCQNTLNLALGSVTQAFKVRHTQKMEGRIAEAKRILGLADKYLDQFDADAQAMMETEVTNGQFFDIVADIYPKPKNDSQAAETRWENRVSLLDDIWRSNTDGPDTMSSIHGTAWGALNALTEALDWYRKPRAGDLEARFESISGFDRVTNDEKDKIARRVMAFVNA